MKSLIIIWLLVLVTLVGGFWYMNTAINQLIQEIPKDSVIINHCNTNGMVLLTHSKCVLTGFNSLEVHNSNPTQLQPVQALYEDEYTPAMELQPTEYLQVTRHSWFIQGTEWGYEVTYDPSIAEDTSLNGVQPIFSGVSL